MMMIDQIEDWIDATNRAFLPKRQSCVRFAQAFSGYFPQAFLEEAGFVMVDRIPKPDFPQLRQLGIDDLLELAAAGMTYKTTYYLLSAQSRNLRLHFHELVHVAQWRLLGGPGFIARYLAEIRCNGYADAPLERMAYALETRYADNAPAFDVPTEVRRQLSSVGHRGRPR